jgi:hypothetical protein
VNPGSERRLAALLRLKTFWSAAVALLHESEGNAKGVAA